MNPPQITHVDETTNYTETQDIVEFPMSLKCSTLTHSVTFKTSLVMKFDAPCSMTK